MSKHKVLIPVDGRDFSRQVVPCVRKFLPADQNDLILLRVGTEVHGQVGMPPKPVAWDVTTSMYSTERDLVASRHPIFASQERESGEADFQREMSNLIDNLEHDGYSIELEVRFGEPGEQIVHFVEHHAIDVVAMTTHSRRGLNRLIFGSVAQYVAQHVSVPILLYRPS